MVEKSRSMERPFRISSRPGRKDARSPANSGNAISAARPPKKTVARMESTVCFVPPMVLDTRLFFSVCVFAILLLLLLECTGRHELHHIDTKCYHKQYQSDRGCISHLVLLDTAFVQIPDDGETDVLRRRVSRP